MSPDEIFREYAYFSSFSDSWLEHARQFADTMIERLGLGRDSRVVEVASNDGYLLRHFVARGVPAPRPQATRCIPTTGICKGPAAGWSTGMRCGAEQSG